ncbi:MAG: type II secretion system F family protein [Nanoarchaeota archaeon]|nr:type II secretion system F family protein [Nanoarchaeota archaeon]
MGYHAFARLYPKKIREGYTRLIRYSNIRANPDRFVGFVIIASLGLALAFAFQFAHKLGLNVFVAFIAAFFGLQFVIYLWLFFQVTKKANAVEKVLPDALQLMSSNLRAGLTVDTALLLSARPEFGLFGHEIERIGKEVTLGKPLDEALMTVVPRIKSDKLEKAMLLIVTGLKSGGELANLIEQTARNIRNQDLTDQKIRSSVLSYVLFIVFAVGAGAPVLYGLSSFLIEVLKKVFAQIKLPATSQIDIPLKITQISLDPAFVVFYAVIALIATSIMSSFVMGAIVKGKGKEGAKYIPLMILMTLLVFFIARKTITALLGDLFNF